MENNIEMEKAKYVQIIEKFYSNSEGTERITGIVEKTTDYINKIVLNSDSKQEKSALEKELSKHPELKDVDAHRFASTLSEYLYGRRNR